MEADRFDRKTFRLETDADGKVVVHHVNGQFNDTCYHGGTFGKVKIELSEGFDTSTNIYFAAIDISSERFNSDIPHGHIRGQAGGIHPCFWNLLYTLRWLILRFFLSNNGFE